MSIRPEQPSDYDAIRRLHLAAFAPSTVEAQLVEDLRAAGDHVPDLCLIYEQGGHVMLSQGDVDSRPALGLGPIGVDPAHQHQGLGAALIREVIARAQHTEYTVIALLGHPAYYPRFGFRPGAELGIATTYDAPPEAWMVLPLPAHAPAVRGVFRYAPAFP